jgi:hypothetical protein
MKNLNIKLGIRILSFALLTGSFFSCSKQKIAESKKEDALELEIGEIHNKMMDLAIKTTREEIRKIEMQKATGVELNKEAILGVVYDKMAVGLSEELNLSLAKTKQSLGEIGYDKESFIDKSILSKESETSEKLDAYTSQLQNLVKTFETIGGFEVDLERMNVDAKRNLSSSDYQIFSNSISIAKSSTQYWTSSDNDYFTGEDHTIQGISKPGQRDVIKADVNGAIDGAVGGGLFGAYSGFGIGAAPGALLGACLGSSFNSAREGLWKALGW